MSYRLNVQPTKFVNIDPETGKELEANYGIRIYDDEGQAYTNNFKTWDELRVKLSKENLLDTMQEYFPDFADGIWSSSAFSGIYVGDLFYNREDLGLK